MVERGREQRAMREVPAQLRVLDVIIEACQQHHVLFRNVRRLWRLAITAVHDELVERLLAASREAVHLHLCRQPQPQHQHSTSLTTKHKQIRKVVRKQSCAHGFDPLFTGSALDIPSNNHRSVSMQTVPHTLPHAAQAHRSITMRHQLRR